jgi:hypothetical protein
VVANATPEMTNSDVTPEPANRSPSENSGEEAGADAWSQKISMS